MSPDEAFPVFKYFQAGKKTGLEIALDIIELKTKTRPKIQAVRMWARAYGRIPSQHIVTLMHELRARGVEFKDSDFDVPGYVGKRHKHSRSTVQEQEI